MKIKTIFFSISSRIVMRNLMLVPGGVFDILKQDKNIQVVVLVNDKLYAKYKQYFDEQIKESNVIIEKIEKDFPKNILQSIFTFFYSYLIFTKTTRLLASRGARADKVAAGSSYAYPFKWLNYQLFGRCRWIKKWLVPRVYMFLFRGRPYKELFERYKPDLVFIPNVAHSPDLDLLSESKRRKIKSVGMSGSWDHFNKYFVPLRSDVFLAWNEPSKKEAIVYEGYNEDQVRLVGFSQFDAYVNDRNITPREEFFKKINLPQDRKVIFFASEGAYSLDGPEVIDMILKWIDEGKIEGQPVVILRLYPGVPSEDSAYAKFAKHPLVHIDKTDNWGSVESLMHFINILYYSDVVISTYSTITVEASIFDKYLININFDGYHERPDFQSVKRLVNFSHFEHVSKAGGVRTVDTAKELLDHINTGVVSPGSNSDNREKLRQSMCWKLDGNSSRRVVYYILEYLNE